MFIKLKLEKKNQNERESSEDAYFIKMPNNATIREAKEQIEEYIDLYADDQIIKNLTDILHDDKKFIEVCDLENREGSALMLFNQNDEFICFLQLYNDAEAERQRQLQQESKRPSFYKNLPATISINLLEESDDDTVSSKGTESTSTSSENSDSTSGSDDDNKGKENHGIKRNLKQNQSQVPAKKRLFTHHSELVTKYLEEHPNYSDGIISSTTPINEKSPDFSENSKSIENIASNVENKAISTSVVENKAGSSSSTDSSRTLVSKDFPSPSASVSRKPCASIAPEKRKFIAIVTTGNCQEFLKTCRIEFECSNSTSDLQFDNKMPIVMHTDGNLWIACSDDYTLEWLLKNITSCGNGGGNIKKLSDNFEYRAYTVVLPKFQGVERSLKEQFQLLERQNKDLNTEKWIVERYHTIENENDEFFEQKVSVLCQNEVVFLQIDMESVKYLKNTHFQVKYCFWKVLFQIRSEDVADD